MTIARRPHAARAITALTAAVGVAVLTPAAAFAAPGPLGPADHDFLAKAHAAVAYAAAASDLAKTNAGAAGVKTIGKQLAAEDKALDKSTRDVAAKLQIALPAAAAVVDELKAVKGEQFDTAYVERVRAAEGSLLELAAGMRVHTRNSIVRDLAQRTAAAMMTQIPLLESSGLIDFTALPAATLPAATAVTHAAPGPAADPGMLAEARAGHGSLWPSIPVAGGVLAVGVLGVLLGSRRIRGSRFRGSRRA